MCAIVSQVKRTQPLEIQTPRSNRAASQVKPKQLFASGFDIDFLLYYAFHMLSQDSWILLSCQNL